MIRAIIGVLLMLCCTTSGSAQDDSPRTRGYVKGLSISEETATVAWRYVSEKNKRPIGLNDVCLCNGVVYVGDDLGVLRAFRSGDGELLWEFEHGERIYQAPVCDGTRVYVSTEKSIEAVSCENGTSVWKKPFDRGGELALWPPMDPGKNRVQMLYVTGSDGFIYTFLPWNGVRRWRRSVMEGVPEDPPGFDGERARFDGSKVRPYGICSDGERVYQGLFDQSRVVVFETTSGDPAWSFNTKGWIDAAPTVDGDEVFIGSQDKCVYCVDRLTGIQKWKFETGSRVTASPTARGDRVFASSCDGYMYCLERSTGKQIWKYIDPDDRKRAIYCDPVVTDDTIYFAVGTGFVYALNTQNGELRWKMQPVPDSQLYMDFVTDGERLFTTCRTGGEKGIAALIAIGPKAESATDGRAPQ